MKPNNMKPIIGDGYGAGAGSLAGAAGAGSLAGAAGDRSWGRNNAP